MPVMRRSPPTLSRPSTPSRLRRRELDSADGLETAEAREVDRRRVGNRHIAADPLDALHAREPGDEPRVSHTNEAVDRNQRRQETEVGHVAVGEVERASEALAPGVVRNSESLYARPASPQATRSSVEEPPPQATTKAHSSRARARRVPIIDPHRPESHVRRPPPAPRASRSPTAAVADCRRSSSHRRHDTTS